MTLKNTDSAYRIIVSNTQTIDNETDTIKEIAYGSYNEKNGKQYIIYRTEGEDASTSIIILDSEGMTIKRRGHTNSSISYIAGKKHAFPYVTPYGTIDMEIGTERLISNVSSGGGTIELAYTLTVSGESYYNNMNITISKR